MLTYAEVSQQLGVPEATVRYKLWEFNRQHPAAEQVKPDKVEDHGSYVKHLFELATIPKIKAALAAVTQRPRGRPPKKEAA